MVHDTVCGICKDNKCFVELDLMPVGMIIPYAGQSAPDNWLICQGQAVSRVTYKELFSVIGTSYGAGDGTLTFNVPDLRGKFALGASDKYALGSKGGEESVTLSINEMPSHNHGGEVGEAGSHQHNYAKPQKDYNWDQTFESGASNHYPYTDVTSTTEAAGNHKHSITSQGGGKAHNNMPPYVGINYLIYAGSA